MEPLRLVVGVGDSPDQLEHRPRDAEVRAHRVEPGPVRLDVEVLSEAVSARASERGVVASDGLGTGLARPRSVVSASSTASASPSSRSITSSTNGERAAGWPSSSDERQLSVSDSVGRETQTLKR